MLYELDYCHWNACFICIVRGKPQYVSSASAIARIKFFVLSLWFFEHFLKFLLKNRPNDKPNQTSKWSVMMTDAKKYPPITGSERIAWCARNSFFAHCNHLPLQLASLLFQRSVNQALKGPYTTESKPPSFEHLWAGAAGRQVAFPISSVPLTRAITLL